MAESLVALAIQWIGSTLIQESSILFGVEDQVRDLQEELELMQQFLQDADAKIEMKEIRTLIRQIRQLAYDVEDIIDTYILEVGAKPNMLWNKGWFMKSACFVHTAPQTYRIGKQIKMLQRNVKRITERLSSYGVRRITTGGEYFRSSSDHERFSRRKPRSYPYDDDAEFIVGLEKDTKKLVEVLVGEGKTQVSLVSIVGMGGSGKSTLARMLYNHPYTKECFDCRAWVYISQEWSTKNVLSEILRKVSSHLEFSKSNAKSSVEELVDKLRSILEKRSYLVVLDDVWRKEALEQILPALPWMNNDKGSKIVITTRNQEVIQFQDLQRHLFVHEPRPLSKEESWELFCKIALNHHTDYNSESYEGLGKEMLQKCDGLPLAIVALAGILNTKRNIREWQQVSETVRTRVMEGTSTHMYGRVGEMLALSYDDIPCDLKPCFLYLGVFPEDCQIPTGMLTRMWIAEGLVTSNEDTSLEDAAMQCLEKLSNRFMIQVVRTNFEGAIKVIHLHDLLRELCIKKAREQSFLQINTPIDNSPANGASKMTIQSRRFALHSSTCFPTQVSNLRSLVLLTRSSIVHSAYVSKETVALENLHQNLKLLRLLNLWGIKTLNGALPTQIGSLIHLRYLGIRASNITELPTSIGKLRNLLTLDYRNIDSDNNVQIPDVLCKLTLLRHLYLPIKCPLALKELQLSALKNLQILWGVNCAGWDWFSREIPNLSTTLKKLKVVVSNERDLEAAFSCPSLMCDRLHTLHCEWSSRVVLRITHVFSHNQHLHKLVLTGKIKVEKLSRILPSNLLVLELKDSNIKDEDPMVVIGKLAHLKLLKLSNSYMGNATTCNLGSFPQLEELYLENLENLSTWEIEQGAMSSLKKLEILSCGKLREFPQGLAFVTTLQHLECFGVPEEFDEQAKAYGWFQERLRLPHNFEAIIKHCDTVLDMSSIQKINEKLTTGIFLNDYKKKFWVMKQEDHQYNCFMLYVTDLLPPEEPDIDALPEYNDYLTFLNSTFRTSEPPYMSDWEWTYMEERDGQLIKVAKLKTEVCMLYLYGRFDVVDLSPNIVYTFSFVFMLDDSEWEEELSCTTSLHLPVGSSQTSVQEISHTLKLSDKPRNELQKVLIGEFETHPKVLGHVNFTWHCDFRLFTKVGITVKGVIIEPKL
ncbi:hypothetical protein BVRB_7g157130 isoform B [Beta vulgaris subsp. vulgaris]|nr:hypothetical protein BVRB_7g157130 isoform B [Beta vulgaris subsp. vulgaris]